MKVIYVDDEKIAIDKFKLLIEQIDSVTVVNTFDSSLRAFEFAKNNDIDIAFLDIEMPKMTGIELAQELHSINENIQIIFITAYSNFAYSAFNVDAVGYLLKPYTLEMLAQAVDKAKRIKPKRSKKVFVQTMPNFAVYVDQKLLPINSAKPKELLALLVYNKGASLSGADALKILWQDKDTDDTNSLYRVTVKRLKTILEEAGIDFIFGSVGSQRFVYPDSFECDYYLLLNGNVRAINAYNGEFLSEYDWALSANKQIKEICKKHFE